MLPTCILVFTTSKGVFPKTLAAPAVAPNIAVTIGCISFLGSSPVRPNPEASQKWKENILIYLDFQKNNIQIQQIIKITSSYTSPIERCNNLLLFKL